LVCCNRDSGSVITIDGTLKNMEPGVNNEVPVFDYNAIAKVPLKVLKIDESGKISDTLNRETGFYMMAIGFNMIQVYLEKGKTLKFSSDYFSFADNLEFGGDHAVLNTFLFKYQSAMDQLIANHGNLLQQDENSLLSGIDIMKMDMFDLIESNAAGIHDTIIRDAKFDVTYSLTRLYFEFREKMSEAHKLKSISKFRSFSESFDFNRPEYLEKSFNYGDAAFRYHLYNYKTSRKIDEPFAGHLARTGLRKKMIEFLLTKKYIEIDLISESGKTPGNYQAVKKELSDKFYLSEVEKAYGELR